MWLTIGASEEYATVMSEMEGTVAAGAEEEIYARPGNVIGKVSFKDFAEANKHVWTK